MCKLRKEECNIHAQSISHFYGLFSMRMGSMMIMIFGHLTHLRSGLNKNCLQGLVASEYATNECRLLDKVSSKWMAIGLCIESVFCHLMITPVFRGYWTNNGLTEVMVVIMHLFALLSDVDMAKCAEELKHALVCICSL
jgi:hypothetical protein